MNSLKMLVVGLTVVTYSFPLYAETVTNNKVNKSSTYNSPYGGSPSPYGAGGLYGSTAQEKEAVKAEMSQMGIDRKAYMDQMMQSFDTLDLNGDGRLGADEMAAAPPTDEGEGLMQPVSNQSTPAATASKSSTSSKSIAPLSGQSSSPVGIAPLGGR